MKRISGLIYEETRGVLKIFLENVRPLLLHCALTSSLIRYPQVIRDSVRLLHSYVPDKACSMLINLFPCSGHVHRARQEASHIFSRLPARY